MEAKNNQLSEEVAKNMKEYQETKDAIQNNVKSEQQIINLSKNIEECRQKLIILKNKKDKLVIQCAKNEEYKKQISEKTNILVNLGDKIKIIDGKREIIFNLLNYFVRKSQKH